MLENSTIPDSDNIAATILNVYDIISLQSLRRVEFHSFFRGPLSQWHPSKFIVNGINYSNAEQFMMAGKARFFQDQESADKIMATADPGVAKDFGRKVANFNESQWEMARVPIVYVGNREKFKQNPDLLDHLLSTSPKVLVEANPRDNIWGCGLSSDSDSIRKPATWPGMNLLGFVLMQVRARAADSRKS